MKKRRVLIAAAVFFVLCLIAFLLYPPVRERFEGPGGSSYDVGTFGTKASFLLLESLGYKVQRWEEHLTSLAEGGLLLIIEPLFPLSSKEVENLEAWVKAGNTLFIADAKDNALFRCFGLELSGSQEGGVTIVPMPSSLTSGVKRIRLKKARRFLPWEKHKKCILLVDDDGVATFVVNYGIGRIIFSSCPDIFANGFLAQEDNCLFLSNLAFECASGKKIFFDEYHHGFTMRRRISDLLTQAEKSSLIQAILAAFALLFLAGARFGTPRPLPGQGGRTAVEYVNSLAGLMRKAEARSSALESIYRSFRLRVGSSLGLCSESPQDTLALALGGRLGRGKEEFIALFEKCERAIHQKDLQENQFLDLTWEIHRVEKELGWLVGNR